MDGFSSEYRDLESLLPEIYEELRSLAQRYLRHERPDHTLQPTALVHEAYVRLAKSDELRWQNRKHFYRLAGLAMRRILVNHARDHGREKRGGSRKKVTLHADSIAARDDPPDLEDLDDALRRMEAEHPRATRVVELRFFVGLSVVETSEVLDLSPATVKREWTFAKAWLLAALNGDTSRERPR